MSYKLQKKGSIIDAALSQSYDNELKTNVVWDDLRFPLIGRNIDSNAGRVDADFINGTLNFATNARYPNEPITMLAQMSHSMKANSELRPHIHWVQTESGTPNWLLAYKFYKNGESATISTDYAGHTLVACESNVFPYVSGNLAQICEFPVFTETDLGTSGMIHFVLFRDSNNTSGLFSGSDSYGDLGRALEFDVHYQKDQLGSRQEFIK